MKMTIIMTAMNAGKNNNYYYDSVGNDINQNQYI